jgi:hypothetical protein
VGQHHTLDVVHLREILLWVLRFHGDVREIRPHTSDAVAILHSETYGSVTVSLDFQALEPLARSLNVVTRVDVSDSVGHLSQVMANVAMMVSHHGRIACQAGQESTDIDPLARRLCTEFAIACADSCAKPYGYDVHPVGLQQRQLEQALAKRDWPLLVRVFSDSLHLADDNDSRSPGGNAEDLMRDIERQFSEAAPIPAPERHLSTESYWNLRSVAEQEGWTPAVVLMLIDEHMSPALYSHLVYHSSTVSGSEWLRLYDWVHRKDGPLWMTQLVWSQ